MKTFNELEFNEREEIKRLFANWLRQYTHEIITEVTAKADEIINNEFAMYLLRELRERQLSEKLDFDNSIGYLLEDHKTFALYNPHNHPTTHSDSYRDILYDMYIRPIHID